ncbi:MAG: glycosyltransferase [Roseimicrobium sp.]
MLRRDEMANRLANGSPLRFLFVNDLGFQHGGGIAMARQVHSLLLRGHEVAALCQWRWPEPESLIPPAAHCTGAWLGLQHLTDVKPGFPWWTPEAISAAVARECAKAYPDVIIVGNLHSVGWPLSVLAELRRTGALVVAYMHDCHLFTGRCAYPGPCEQHLSGCTPSCRTAHLKPVLAPELIPAAWAYRRQLFCGRSGISVATNSRWTLDQMRRSMPGVKHADVVHLALDERVFSPGDKAAARTALGIPQDKLVVLGGAVDMEDPRKGADLLKGIIERLRDEAHFVIFGHASEQLAGVQPLPYSQDPARAALLNQAADIFVGTSREEAFGQTVLEAAACAVPCVALNAGGIPDIIEHGVTGYLARRASPAEELGEMTAAVQAYLREADLRRVHGEAARNKVEQHYTLQLQGQRWERFVQAALAAS